MSKKIIIGVMLLIMLTIVVLGGTAYYTYASYTAATVDLETDPPTGFINLINMAPGDAVSKTIKVLNKGTLDYDYKLSSVLEEGDQLFQVLLLDVEDSSGNMIYSGLLGGLINQYVSTIAAGTDQNLNFIVSLPKDVDNKIQSKLTRVSFRFDATEHHVPDPPDNGRVIFEPPVINNQFALLAGSSVPIKFHLATPTGELEQTAREGITLEVIGPNSQGIQMVYTFSLNDSVDTLKFDENLTDAHYVAVFASKTYPVLVGGMYRAQVKENGKVIGYIDFMAGAAPNTCRSNSMN